MSTSNTKQWDLEPETEYRFELDPGTTLAIKLVHGHAEIFGAELAEGRTYLFGYECKAAIYTWQGCTIEIRPPLFSSHYCVYRFAPHVIGQPSTEYVSEETPMSAYANVHLALETMRVRARTALAASPPSEDEEPRVLVLGPENSGKTTVCKTLANYAVRAAQDWAPVYVNVDPGEGGNTIPGTLTATPMTAPFPTASPASPLGTAATSAPSTLTSNALLPLVYWYGHAETRRNPLLMDRLIRNLGEGVRERGEIAGVGRAAGLIVDTPSTFASSSSTTSADHRQMLIKACVDAFRINVILVVGHEKLNVEMQRTFGNRINVVKIPKSGGVVELDVPYRQRIHTSQLHTYMYGQPLAPPPGADPGATAGGEAAMDMHLAPSSSVIAFDDLTIFRIGEETMAPSSALPIGATRTVSEMQPVQLDPGMPGTGLRNAILALLAPPHPDEAERYDEEVLDLQVVGFLAVTNIDVPGRKLTVLSPSPGSFTGRTAIVGSFEWTEQ